MIETLLATALRLRQSGRLADAAEIYRQVLGREPRHFEALHALGVVRYQEGEIADAERLIGEALAVKPDAPDALYNRGCLLVKLSRPDEALRSFDGAIAAKPDYLEPHVNRGSLLAGMNRHAAALASFETAIALRPTIAELWTSRAAALSALGRLEEAIASCDRALALKPTHQESQALRSRLAEAQQELKAANAGRPSLRAFEDDVAGGRLEEAFQRGLQILDALDGGFGRLNGIDCDEPGADGSDEDAARRFSTRFMSAFARLLLETEFELSMPAYERLVLYHRWIDLLASLSELASSDQANIEANDPTLLARLALRPLNSSEEVDLEDIWGADRSAAAAAFLRYVSSPYVFRPRAFELRERLLEWLPQRLPEVALSPLTLSRVAGVYMHCSYAMTPKKHVIKSVLIGKLRDALLQAGCSEIEPGARSRIAARPTIVVVAENFRPGHSVHRTHSRAIASLRERFRVVGVIHPRPTDVVIESLFDECIDVPGGEFFQLVRHLANQIVARNPALIFYLGVGMTPQFVGLASLRLAPIQCVSFGHTATTMSSAIDHFVLPQDFVGSPSVFSENVLALPKAAMPFTQRPSSARPRMGQLTDVVRIAVPGSTMKLNPRLFGAIREIIARVRVPTEVQFFPLGGIGLVHAELTRVVRERIKGAIVCPELPHEAYGERLSRCDLFLSPFPYGNMNGIIDCFQLGLAGVCLDGAEAHAHTDGAFFARIGLPSELTAQSVEDYVAAAARLADDSEWRSHCRSIVTGADLDAAFFEGDERLFCKAIADLLGSRQA